MTTIGVDINLLRGVLALRGYSQKLLEVKKSEHWDLRQVWEGEGIIVMRHLSYSQSGAQDTAFLLVTGRIKI